MLIHKDEIHEGTLRNFLSLIYSTGSRGTFYIFLDKENSRTISNDQDFLGCSTKFTVFHSGMFYNILLEKSSTFRKHPDYSFSF